MIAEATALSSTLDAIKQLISGSGGVGDRLKTSLPEFTKPLLLESPNFMQASLAEEPICGDILKNLYNVYIGYVLCALQMDQLVVGDRKVRDMVGTVATAESFGQFIDTDILVSGLGGSLEAAHSKSGVTKSGVTKEEEEEERLRLRAEKEQDRQALRAEKEQDRQDLRAEKEQDRQALRHESYQDSLYDKAEAEDTARTNSGITGTKYNAKDSLSLSLASGRQVEVTFSTSTGGKIAVTLNVKFNTRLIPEKVVEYILGQDYTNDIARRWLQYRSGEISFVKDFVLGMDRLNRRATALKHDTDHALADIFKHKSKSSFKRMLNISGSNNRSYNLANSILMLDEETAVRFTKRSGFNFSSFRDRQRLFDNTYNLFIVLVDSRYSRVSIYTNGIEQSATYSFNDLKASASSDKMSLKDVMEYLSKSQMPKF